MVYVLDHQISRARDLGRTMVSSTSNQGDQTSEIDSVCVQDVAQGSGLQLRRQTEMGAKGLTFRDDAPLPAKESTLLLDTSLKHRRLASYLENVFEPGPASSSEVVDSPASR